MEEPCPLANPTLDFQLHLIGITRAKMRELAEGLSREQLFTIPKGFHNNILWNLGHAVVAQQALCYKNSGLPLRIPGYALPFFAKGSRPSEWTGSIDPAEVLLWLDETLDFLREDLRHQVFHTYSHYTTSMGNTLHNISEALAYVTWHEGLHLGVMLSQRKLV
jgi:hypothetical protein